MWLNKETKTNETKRMKKQIYAYIDAHAHIHIQLYAHKITHMPPPQTHNHT